MAKKTVKTIKTVFDLTDDEVRFGAKTAQNNAIDQIPEKAALKQEVAEDIKKEKPQFLYVDKNHHNQAKINAVKRGLKLGEYIEYLIAQDTKIL